MNIKYFFIITFFFNNSLLAMFGVGVVDGYFPAQTPKSLFRIIIERIAKNESTFNNAELINLPAELQEQVKTSREKYKLFYRN